jgi:hypothetical protein
VRGRPSSIGSIRATKSVLGEADLRGRHRRSCAQGCSRVVGEWSHAIPALQGRRSLHPQGRTSDQLGALACPLLGVQIGLSKDSYGSRTAGRAAGQQSFEGSPGRQGARTLSIDAASEGVYPWALHERQQRSKSRRRRSAQCQGDLRSLNSSPSLPYTSSGLQQPQSRLPVD